MEIEIVVVDDNSPDKTAEVVRAMQGIYGESKIILHSRGGKLGLGSAYIDGLEFCSGNFIFLMDADMSHHPKFIPEFIKYCIYIYIYITCRKQKEMDADIITGTRYNSKGGVFGWNLWRKMTSRVANHIATVLLNPQVSDLTGSFRLYKREALSRVMKSVKSKGYVFQMEAIIRAQYMGYNIHQVFIYIYIYIGTNYVL